MTALFLSRFSLYDDDFEEDEDLPEEDILALKGLEKGDQIGNTERNQPWAMVAGIDDDDDDDYDDDFY